MKTRPETCAEIVRLHHAEGWPIGTIAQQLGVHTSVVTRVLGQAGVVPAVTMPRPSKVDPYLPFLRETKGSIVNTSSVSGEAADWRMSPYNAAKGGVSNFTKAAALDNGGFGVRVNAVAPGLIWTDLTQSQAEDEELKREFSERIALGRGGRSEEVAAAVLYLCSPGAGAVTGQSIVVAGGELM